MRILIEKIFIGKIDDVVWNFSFLQLDISEIWLKNKFENWGDFFLDRFIEQFYR